MNHSCPKSARTWVGAIAFTLVITGCLLYGSNQAHAFEDEQTRTLHRGMTMDRYMQLQGMKWRWKQGSASSIPVSQAIVEEAAKQLGMSRDQLAERMSQGWSIGQIARNEGVNPWELAERLLAPRLEVIEAAIASGRLDRSRGEQIIRQLRNRLYGSLCAKSGHHGAEGGDQAAEWSLVTRMLAAALDRKIG